MRIMWHDPTNMWLLSWLLLVGIGVVVAALVFAVNRDTKDPTPTAAYPTPEDTLRMRLARGEISIEEYESRMATLHARHHTEYK